MKSTSTHSGKLRNLKVIKFILISCIFLTLNNFKSYAQVRNYATVTPSTGVTKATIGVGASPAIPDASGGSVLTPENAAIGDNVSFATLTSNFTAIAVTGSVGEAWLQLKFPQPIGAGKTTYIRFAPPTSAGLNLSLLSLVSNLTGLLKNDIVKLEAYSGATAGSTGTIVPAANVTTTIVQDPQGNNYFAVTSTNAYNSVRIRLSLEVKLLDLANGSISMKVYNAFTIPGAASCGSGSFASTGESSGINVTLTPLATNPTSAADNNLSTFSQLQVGLIGVGATISQTIFFAEPSDANAVAKVWLSIPPSILTVNVFNEVKLQAFNGNIPVGAPVATNSLLGGLDLLGLLSKRAAFPVFYSPGELSIGFRLALPMVFH